MSYQYIYKHFRTLNYTFAHHFLVCSIRYDVNRDVLYEINNKSKLIRLSLLFTITTILLTDTFYYLKTKPYLTKSELVYMTQMPIIFILLIWLIYYAYYDQHKFITFIRAIKIVDDHLTKHHMAYDDKTFRTINLIIRFIMITYPSTSAIFLEAIYNQIYIPCVKMYATDYLFTYFYSGLILATMVCSELVIDRIRQFNRFLKDFAKDVNTTKVCLNVPNEINRQRFDLTYVTKIFFTFLQQFCFCF